MFTIVNQKPITVQKSSKLQLDFNFENPYLNQLLPQLIKNHKVVQLFYTPQTNHENARLIVHLQPKHEAVTLQNQQWVTKLHNRHYTFVHCFYSTQLHHSCKIGNPFIMAYCQPSALIYTNKDIENHLLLNPADKKKHRKKYKAYKQQFHHDHDLLQAQLFPVLAADCATAVLLHYENLLNHNLEYLESLYTGSPNNQQILNERIHTLIKYAPQIQKHFVKKSGNAFLLIDLIEKAKKASLEAECFFGSEHYKAFEIAEAAVFQMIENRFQELKRIIKQTHPRERGDLIPPSNIDIQTPLSVTERSDVLSLSKCRSVRKRLELRKPPFNIPSLRGHRSNLVPPSNSSIKTPNQTPLSLGEGLGVRPTPEEIYQFHHTTNPREGGDLVNQLPPVTQTNPREGGDLVTQTYYLLLIGNSFSNQLLKNLTTKLNAQTRNNVEFVLIAHTRSWIQEWLYAQQDFFKKIIKEENRIFTTSPHHPKPHWEHPYAPHYPDLDLYHKQTVQAFDQFLLMADRQTDNYSGVANLFSLFFLTFCKTYLFATISYYPNNLHSKALWQLCLYANPELKRYEYLFQELEIPFFSFLDHYRTVQHSYPFNQKQKTRTLIKIADELLNELQSKLPSPVAELVTEQSRNGSKHR